MSTINYLTKEGYQRLKVQLDDMKSNGRIEIGKAIAEAREKGDLSENAEYDSAKEAQGLLELKISEMESVLANARIIDQSRLDTSKVVILSTVRMRNLKTQKEMTVKLVSEAEADPAASMLSVTSPVGKGILGKAVGETAKVITPAGVIDWEILDISITL
jgi:transcription elongation factor GreA